MRRRIALQKHFVRNQGKRLHGFAIALGVRTACPPCAGVRSSLSRSVATLRESL